MAESALEPRLELLHHALTHRDLPSTEQEPLGGTVFHLTLRFHCVVGLRHWFGDRRDVLVAGNSFVYYDHVAKDGQVEARRICPDVFVVFGVAHHRQDRDSYVVWDEGPAPAFVLEVASKSAKGRDKGMKRHVYAEMGVSEYFLLDARMTSASAAERLQGFKLCKGRYVPLPMVPLPHPAGALRAESIESAHPLLRIGIASDVLGLYLCPGYLDVMRLYDPNTGQYINTHEQALHGEAAALRQAAAARERSEAAEAELRSLRQQLQALRRQ